MSDSGSALLLVVDVGNTNAVFGLFRGSELISDFRVSTQSGRTADEYASLLLPLLAAREHSRRDIESVLVSSVVPSVERELALLAKRHFDVDAVFVDSRLDTGMEVHYDNPAEVGADRIVNSVAARDAFGAPVITVDFGTALTFDVVDETGAYVGGVIVPGIGISAQALFSRASRLYNVDVSKPAKILGSNTSEAMQAGLYYGYVGLVDGILERLLAELPAACPVVATGGQAPLIASESRLIGSVDPNLTLKGLRLIAERQGARADSPGDS